MAKILVYSYKEFKEICDKNNLCDNNIENKNVAIISICNSSKCCDFFGDYNEPHWFINNHSNVLNLEFDDSTSADNESYLKPMSMDDAIKAVDFIEDNLGKTFIIHCSAGKSRSQAFFKFITTFYNDTYNDNCGRKENPCLYPNYYVNGMLKHAYYLKHKIKI